MLIKHAELYIEFNHGESYSTSIEIKYQTDEHLEAIIGEISDSIFGMWADIPNHSGEGLIPIKDIYINTVTDDGEIVPLVCMSELISSTFNPLNCVMYRLNKLQNPFGYSLLTMHRNHKFPRNQKIMLSPHYRVSDSKFVEISYTDDGHPGDYSDLLIKISQDCYIKIIDVDSDSDVFNLEKFLKCINYNDNGKEL